MSQLGLPIGLYRLSLSQWSSNIQRYETYRPQTAKTFATVPAWLDVGAKATKPLSTSKTTGGNLKVRGASYPVEEHNYTLSSHGKVRTEAENPGGISLPVRRIAFFLNLHVRILQDGP